MNSIEIIQASPQLLKEEIVNDVKALIDNLEKNFQPKEKTKYLTRTEVADMFSVNISTVHNWTKKGTLKSYGISGTSRIYFKREEIEEIIIKLN